MVTFKNNPFAPFVGIEPITTLDGEQIVTVKTTDHRGYVPTDHFGNGGTAAMKTLGKFNITPLPEVRAKIMAAIPDITEFPESQHIARPGSVRPYYALQDGTVFHPGGVMPAEAIFPPSERGFSTAGTFEEWLDTVAMPLHRNPRAQMLVALPMAAVIAELCDGVSNVGIDLSGPPATGKTTGLMLAASVMGGAVDREASCMVSMNATSNGLELIIPRFRNSLLVLEEGQLFNASDNPKTRATKWREFAHRLADGSSKLRGKMGESEAETATTMTPLWFVLNSNESIAEVLGGGDTAPDRAVLQRIHTVPANGKYGLFDKLPAGVIGGAAFSDSLQAAMLRNHGTAIRKFLQKFVDLRHKDEARLKEKIAGHMQTFQQKVGLDPNDGEASRAAKVFGLIYAAIRLSQHFGVLPANWNALRIARRCHTLNRAAVLHRRPFKVRLQSYASRRDLVRLERGNLPDLSDAQVQTCPGFIKERDGQTLLVLSVRAYKRAFPDWKKLKQAAASFVELDGDGRHHPKHQVQRRGGKHRMMTFVIA